MKCSYIQEVRVGLLDIVQEGDVFRFVRSGYIQYVYTPEELWRRNGQHLDYTKDWGKTWGICTYKIFGDSFDPKAYYEVKVIATSKEKI